MPGSTRATASKAVQRIGGRETRSLRVAFVTRMMRSRACASDTMSFRAVRLP